LKLFALCGAVAAVLCTTAGAAVGAPVLASPGPSPFAGASERTIAV